MGPLLVPLDYFYKDILTPWVLAILLYILARAYYFLREATLSSLCIVLFLQGSLLGPFLARRLGGRSRLISVVTIYFSFVRPFGILDVHKGS